ncbi:MAG: hypothetical protein JO257_18570 [Deltaproteobacteria bacterium]|nr:hypothetical protein [Deltaproteobacteria bacterium]
MKKDGYVDVHDFIVLMDGDKAEIACDLVAAGSGSDGKAPTSRPCVLK